MKIRVVNGRWARSYFMPDPRLDPLAVTYHKRVRGRVRQLTISDKLMRRVLRPPLHPVPSDTEEPNGR